tara:strand:+ start:300 stop:551 length:252 start_codon:yes stop_codon:yes gene_type:complete
MFTLNTLVLTFSLLKTLVPRLLIGNGLRQEFNMATFRKRNDTWQAQISFEGRKFAKSLKINTTQKGQLQSKSVIEDFAGPSTF